MTVVGILIAIFGGLWLLAQGARSSAEIKNIASDQETCALKIGLFQKTYCDKELEKNPYQQLQGRDLHQELTELFDKVASSEFEKPYTPVDPRMYKRYAMAFRGKVPEEDAYFLRFFVPADQELWAKGVVPILRQHGMCCPVKKISEYPSGYSYQFDFQPSKTELQEFRIEQRKKELARQREERQTLENMNKF